MQQTKERSRFPRRVFAAFLGLLFVLLQFVPFWHLAVPAFAASESTSKEAQIKALDQAIERNQKIIDENEKKKSSAQDSEQALQEQVTDLQTEIAAYNEKIDGLNQKIVLLTDEIQANQKQIDKLEQSIAGERKTISKARQRLGNRMRAMYMSGNVSNIELLLDTDSFASFLNRLELLDRISKDDSKTVRTLKASIDAVEKQEEQFNKAKETLGKDKKEIESARADVQDDMDVVADKKAVLDDLIEKLNDYMEELDTSSAEAQQNILLAQQAQDAFMNNLNGNLIGISSVGSGTYVGGMMWPVPDSASYISSGYGPRSIGSGYHYGIDIADPNGGTGRVAIVASASGTVRVSSNICTHNYRKNYNCGCNGGYGNYVVIDHGNGLLSYYGHMTRTTVQQGQIVQKGQVIGTMGCSGFATGPHLHFEIRVNNGQSRSMAARNPLNYVSKPN